MSLDLLVFCDCFERGALKRQPPSDWNVHITPDGCRECGSTDPRAMASFGLWHETACGHDYGILAHRRLGGEDGVRTLSGWLQSSGLERAEILARILKASSGLEGHLGADEVHGLLQELQGLGSPPLEALPLLDGLEEMAIMARRIGKPLVY